jgi:hypothetical protein
METAAANKKANEFGCVPIIIITVIIIFLLKTCSGGCGSFGSMDSKAQVMAKDFVKSGLISPASADVSVESETDLGNNEFMVSGYVDSENGFGANIRKNFKVKLRYTGGEWTEMSSWTMEDLSYN